MDRTHNIFGRWTFVVIRGCFMSEIGCLREIGCTVFIKLLWTEKSSVFGTFFSTKRRKWCCPYFSKLSDSSVLLEFVHTWFIVSKFVIFVLEGLDLPV